MIARILLVAAALFAAPSLHAQSAWPAKPVRWVVPFAPGGPTDVVVRVVGPKLAERIGQPVIIDNRPGAAGNIGTELVAKSAPDGHSLLYVVPALVTNPVFFKASVDPREFAPVIQVTSVSMVLLSSNAFAAKTAAEVIAQIRARPGAVSCGSSGALPTVGCELLRSHAGAAMLMVAYKGNAPALNALMGGEIDLLFDVVNTALPQVKGGRVRAIASMNPQRGGAFPELPSMSETVPGFELVTWQGVVVPAATPRDTVLRINREIAAVLDLPDVRQRLADTGLGVAGGSAEAFEEVIRRDAAKYAKVLSEAGVKAE